MLLTQDIMEEVKMYGIDWICFEENWDKKIALIGNSLLWLREVLIKKIISWR